jgi:hypothetical protein
MDCIMKCGSRWLGLRYRFPLVWLPTRKYQQQYQVKQGEAWWVEFIVSNGYRAVKEYIDGEYNLTTLHLQHVDVDSD